jgi:hypothetical protein
MMIRARLLAFLLGLSTVALPALAAEQQAGDASLPADISGLKMDIVTLNREISQLENELLFPSSQTSVLLSIDVGASVRLVDINLSLDDKNVGYHFYSDPETAALAKGGVQRVFSSNVTSGQHALKAAINGYDAQGKAFQRTVSYTFTKGPQRKVIEITAGDDPTRTQSEFRFKEWESQ